MSYPVQIRSDFLILDVKGGRKALAKRIAKGGKVRVSLIAEIDTQHGSDDGVSIEFSGKVVCLEAEIAALTAPLAADVVVPRLHTNTVVVKHLDLPKAFAFWWTERDRHDDCRRDAEDKDRCGEDTTRLDRLARQHDDNATEVAEEIAEEIARITGLTVEQLREVLG